MPPGHICPHCGKSIAPGDRFCAYCGGPVGDAKPGALAVEGKLDRLLYRTLPFTALAMASGVVTGWLRGVTEGFIVGLQGMLFGGILGWAVGRIARRDPLPLWNLQARLRLTLWFVVVFAVTHIIALSATRSPSGETFRWLGLILSGLEKEQYTGYRRYTRPTTGAADGVGWIVLCLIDFAMMAFLFLAFCTIGVMPDKQASRRDAGASVGSEKDEELQDLQELEELERQEREK